MIYRLIILFLILASHELVAQELINGMVADSASFSPMPYVNVLVKNKNKGTITDMQGNFKIVAGESDTLVISFVGYHPVELPVAGWQPSVILLAENVTVLKTVTIEERRIKPYEGMFDEQNAEWERQNQKLPFYYSRSKKQKIRIGRLENENLRVKTYVEVVIQNEELKKQLMQTYSLTENQYYDLLADFNGQNYSVMYYLTAGELIKIINDFFAVHARKK